jgi:hypothetical protein
MLRESRSNAGGRCCRQGVHDLLRAGAKHELAAHGPMVAAERVASDPPGQLALRFCRATRTSSRRSSPCAPSRPLRSTTPAALLPALVHAVPLVRLVKIRAPT